MPRTQWLRQAANGRLVIMTDEPQPPAMSPDAPDAPTQEDRRRPGRPSHVSPELVDLLRSRAPMEDETQPPPAPGPVEGADLPLTGILLGVTLSIPLWIAIGFAVRAILRWLL